MSVLGFTATVYASRGWPVVPLEPRGKVPLARLVRHGVEHATTDQSVIAEWWGRYPHANVGIACRDLLVVDVDPRNDGEAQLAQLLARHGAFPKTLTARSGSGGLHVLFQKPEQKLRGKLCKGVDLVSGARRYIVAAPSVHPSGGRYEWMTPPSVPLAAVPDWIIESASMVVLNPTTIGTSAKGCNDNDQADDERNELLSRAARYVSKIDPAISGSGGHSTTFGACCRIVRLFGGLSDRELLQLLEPWNGTCKPAWPKADLERKLLQARRECQ